MLTLASLATAASAWAGKYHVYSCRTPSGEIAPADGWSGSEIGSEAFAENTCAQPAGALIAALRAEPRTANSDSATWMFAAPANETIAGATLWRAGDADGGVAVNAFYGLWFAGPENLNEPASAFGQCVGGSTCPTGVGSMSQPLAAENRLVVPGPNLGSHLYMNVSCAGESGYKCREGEHDPNGYAAVVYLYAADLTLEQSAPPTATNVSGELASAPSISGTTDVTFSASDPGSGVYEAVFSVDGHVVQSTVVNENGGRCRNVGQTTDGLVAFLYVQPCPASVSADVGFDTTRVSNGAHHLVVSVIDAAGNAATVLDRTITVDNPLPPGTPPPPGPPNGTDASAQATLTVGWKGSTKEHITSAYGRTHMIDGQLTGPGGVPITGAQINLTETSAYQGAKAATMASPTTGPNGRFSVKVPDGVASCALQFAYREHIGDTLPVATRTLTLTVKAGMRLKISPRTVSVGGRIFFKGKLLGGPIPAGGKQIVLEARSPGGPWIEFDVVKTAAKGRFHDAYRFKFPGPVSYSFRAVSESEADYPFATGASNIVRVFER